jgi:hypothetical protein
VENYHYTGFWKNFWVLKTKTPVKYKQKFAKLNFRVEEVFEILIAKTEKNLSKKTSKSNNILQCMLHISFSFYKNDLQKFAVVR